MEDKSVKIGTAQGVSIVTGTAENVSSTYTQEQRQNLAEAAAEIQQLLTQLEKSYPTNTTVEKMTVAIEAVKYIDSNPTLNKRVLAALKAGGVKALAQILNHPASSFVIGALEDWQKSKGV